MRVFNRIKRILLFLLSAVLLTQTASALLVNSSSYYEGYTIFDGTLSNGKTAKVAIEFAVYDTGNNGWNEFEAVFSSMGMTAPDAEDFSDYIYAYKIYNYGSENDGDDAITAFSILNLDEQANGIVGLGAYDDGTDGAEPSTYGFEDGDCIWQWFPGEEGLRFIGLGDRSWLLVFSSIYPISDEAGEYELRGTEDSDLPKPEVPEPAVIVLLGAGSALLLKRKRKTNS
jgi:hypothetical protein